MVSKQIILMLCRDENSTRGFESKGEIRLILILGTLVIRINQCDQIRVKST